MSERDVTKMRFGTVLTVGHAWEQDDMERWQRSEVAERAFILPTVGGAMLMVQAGEVILRIRLTRPEMMFYLGVLGGVASQALNDWHDGGMGEA